MKRTLIRILSASAIGIALGWLMAAQPAPAASQSTATAITKGCGAGDAICTVPSPPVIPPDMKAKFWKAQAEFLAAQQAAVQAAQAAQQKQVAAQTIQLEIQDKVCGKKFDLKPDANNDPVCVEKPKPEPKK